MENAAASLVPSRIALNMSTITLQQHLGRLAAQRTMTLATQTAIGPEMMGAMKDYFQRYQQYASDFLAEIRNTTNPNERIQRASRFADYNLTMLRFYYQYMQTYMSENPSQAPIIRRNFEGIREGFRNNIRELLETVKSETPGREADIEKLRDIYNNSLDEMRL
jgi:hypothetical protein